MTDNRQVVTRLMSRVLAKARPAAMSELEHQADALVAEMRAKVAKGETGHLAASIRREPGPRPNSVRVRAGGTLTRKPIKGDSIFGAFVAGLKAGLKGQEPYYDYARAIEFGIQGVPPQPFFFATYRKRKRAIRKAVKDAMKRAVETA
ncbi:hypothetical protein [Blastochloris tepida]|uniref:HK97 gp10 family phage protein n=1 Tax=Blastochloris tepida TaxID=2233851 RepID=A0A348G1E5_9HYPH|nr:hypothetical protein [Blastochloris tepida]BBF93378.1 hypothetical protein BLTE_20630 [Blastochloris tepida]